MAENYKITQSEVDAVHIAKEPDLLSGSAKSNKQKFDEYSDMIVVKHNLLADVVTGLSPEQFIIDQEVIDAFTSDGMR